MENKQLAETPVEDTQKPEVKEEIAKVEEDAKADEKLVKEAAEKEWAEIDAEKKVSWMELHEMLPRLIVENEKVKAAELDYEAAVETLKSEGPFTVFAPTEDAFAAALEALGLTAEELLADVETLTAVLTYHVVPGKVMAGDLTGAMSMAVATVQGAEISVTESNGAVTINEATVVAADIEASNGCLLYTSPSPRDVEESR